MMKSNDAKGKIDVLYEQLVTNPATPNLMELEYVYEEYCNLYNKMDSSLKLLRERRFLTELHFIALPSIVETGIQYMQETAFPLTAHERYHEVSRDLINHARDFFRDSKTFLNDFTRYCGKSLPQTMCRGITFSSFGRCVNKCNCPECFDSLDLIIQDVLTPFSQKGVIIDETICKYRDKFIEHSDSLTHPELLTGPKQLQLVHMQSINKATSSWTPKTRRSAEDERMVQTSFIPQKDTLFLRNKNDQLWAYFHVHSMISNFSFIEKGQSIGDTADSTGLHFKKYGSHFHIFPPNQETLPPEQQNDIAIYPAENYRILGISPDVTASIQLLSDFFYDVLKRLQRYWKCH